MPVLSVEEKMSWWISRRLNVLFRCGPGVCVTSNVMAAFEQSGLRWRAVVSGTATVQQVLGDASVEVLFVAGLDRAPRSVRRIVMNLLTDRTSGFPDLKLVWASVSVVDEFDLDPESADPAQADCFDLVVDVEFNRGRTSELRSPKIGWKKVWRDSYRQVGVVQGRCVFL